MSRGKKRMKLLVFTLDFWVKRFRVINKDKNDSKCNNTKRDKTAYAIQDQIELGR